MQYVLQNVQAVIICTCHHERYRVRSCTSTGSAVQCPRPTGQFHTGNVTRSSIPSRYFLHIACWVLVKNLHTLVVRKVSGKAYEFQVQLKVIRKVDAAVLIGNTAGGEWSAGEKQTGNLWLMQKY